MLKKKGVDMEHIINKTNKTSLIKITKFYLKITNSKFLVSLFLSLIIIAVIIQIYALHFLPLYLVIINCIPMIILANLAIYGVYQKVRLMKTTEYLKESFIRNRNAQTVDDSLHTFRHNFSNILITFDGYIINDDFQGLKKYYMDIRKKYNYINNLNAINSDFITDPGIYNLISLKYIEAENLNITFNINISVKFDNLQISSYELATILGILLDNALDATKNCEEKVINFDVSACYVHGKIIKHIITIQNTYSNKDVDIDKIREKGYTSKASEKGSHGLGLWDINNLLKKSKNLNLYTSKGDKYFTQELEIYSL